MHCWHAQQCGRYSQLQQESTVHMFIVLTPVYHVDASLQVDDLSNSLA